VVLLLFLRLTMFAPWWSSWLPHRKERNVTPLMDRTPRPRARRIAAAGMATVVTALALAFSAAPAQAWTRGNVWVNFGSWNCPSGGTVVGVYWAVDSFSVGPAGGDWGDNVIYPSVRVGSGSYNTLSYQLQCRKWGWTYRGAVGQRSLSPYRSGLSYWY